MLFSVFTPTNDLTKLARAARSLSAQTFTDFEWVIGLNNEALNSGSPAGQAATLAREASDDLQLKTRMEPLLVTPDEPKATHVGYLKKLTCGLCEGQYLVELDHDDELTPNALERIAEAIQDKGDPEFLYSDSVHIHAKDGTTQWYSGRYGWPAPYLYKPTPEHPGYLTNPAFPVSAASLHDIFYAPDHVRVWQAAFYDAIGGHNPDLAIADDHELLIRTYLAGGRMVHIPEVLYHYWLHEDGSNTYLQRNKEIQEQQAWNGDRYREALIAEWCRREQLLRVELGGGRQLAETGVLGVALRDADVTLDLRSGLPFPDRSVGHIHAQDFLEHIPHCRDSTCTHEGARCTVGLMNEIHRVLAPNGWFTSSTPSTDGRGAFQDPTHCSFWNSNSFWYYTMPNQQAFVPGITARFIQKRLANDQPSKWHRLHNIVYTDAVLIALHEPNQPGDNAFWRDADAQVC